MNLNQVRSTTVKLIRPWAVLLVGAFFWLGLLLATQGPTSNIQTLAEGFVIGLGGNLFVLWLAFFLLPNYVLDILNRSMLPFFWRKESGHFPHDRFFTIIENEARSLDRIDILAHFHSQWLGIRDDDRPDTTGYRGTFYDELFSSLRRRLEGKKQKPVLLKILFLDINKCSEGMIGSVADLLHVPGKSLEEKTSTAQRWSASGKKKFEEKIFPEMKRLIYEGVLSNDSEIRWANFAPTMGIISVKFRDDTGDNQWVQAEILSHSDEPIDQSRLTIMLQKISAFGHHDDRVQKFESIIEGEFKKSTILDSCSSSLTDPSAPAN